MEKMLSLISIEPRYFLKLIVHIGIHEYLIDTNTLAIAKNNGKIWNDRRERFTNLPSNLQGANVADISAERLNRGGKIRLLTQEPSIIYLIHRHSRSNELNKILRQGGWAPFDDDESLINGSKTVSWAHGTVNNAISIELPPNTIYSILSKGKIYFLRQYFVPKIT